MRKIIVLSFALLASCSSDTDSFNRGYVISKSQVEETPAELQQIEEAPAAPTPLSE